MKRRKLANLHVKINITHRVRTRQTALCTFPVETSKMVALRTGKTGNAPIHSSSYVTMDDQRKYNGTPQLNLSTQYHPLRFQTFIKGKIYLKP